MFLSFVNFYWQFIKDFNKIARQLTSILRIANLSKNLLTSVGVVEKDEVISNNGYSKINENLSKSQKLKNLIVLSNLDANAKGTGFLAFKAHIAFI